MNGIEMVLLGVCERGLLFSLIVLSVYLASRVMRVDDLSLEGSFLFGAAVSAKLLLAGVAPGLVLAISGCVGAGVGALAMAIHSYFNISLLVCGLVVTSGLFSVVLSLAGANLSLIGVKTCFSFLQSWCGSYSQVFVLLFLSVAVFAIVTYCAHQSVFGLLSRATGANPVLVNGMGKSALMYKIIALICSNAITAFAGGLYVQYAGYFSIWMNVGILVVALTGLMIAELFSLRWLLFHLIIGSTLYQALLAVVFECDIDPQWSKLLTAVFVIAVAGLKLIHERSQKMSKDIS